LKTPRKRSSVGSEPTFLQGEELLAEVLRSIRDAKRVLRIAMRNTLVSTRFEIEIEQALKRGVDVRILHSYDPTIDDEKLAAQLGTIRMLLQRGAKLQLIPDLQSELIFSDTSCLLLSTPLAGLDDANQSAVAFEFDAERHPTNYLKLRSLVEALEESAVHVARLPAFATNVGKEGAVGLIATTAVPRSERKRNPLARAEALKRKRKRKRAHEPQPNAPHEEPGCCISCALDIVFNDEKPLCRDCHEDWAALPWEEREGRYCHSCGEMDVTSEEEPFCFECEQAS